VPEKNNSGRPTPVLARLRPIRKDDFMSRVQFKKDGATESQRNGEQRTVPRALGREAGFPPAHETTLSSFSAGAPPVNKDHETESAATPSVRHRWIAETVILLIIISGVVLGFLLHWRECHTASPGMNQLAIPTVSVVSLAPLIPVDGLILPAEVHPWREASISAYADGYIKDWMADMGTRVQDGQLLAEIETPGLNRQLEEAQAQLVLAQAKLHLAETLLKAASMSAQGRAEAAAGRETAAADVDAKRADVRRLQEQVSSHRIVAPFAGTITKREVDIGELVSAASGQEMFHIAQTRRIRVYVWVPKPYALSIAPGRAAILTILQNPGRIFTAKVTTISGGSTSRTLLGELEVDNSQHQILPYSYGEITFKPSNLDPPLTLPTNALLLRRHGLQVAVVRSDNIVELRSLQIGRNFGETIEILGGVTPSDRVISNPTDSLTNGAKVLVNALGSLSARKTNF
jgi:membrane fusion protein, multidrug efflux system